MVALHIFVCSCITLGQPVLTSHEVSDDGSGANPPASCRLSDDDILESGEEGSFSADGKILLFQRRVGEGYVVGIKDLPDGIVRWISPKSGSAIHPAWCGDGSVLFTYANETGTAFSAARIGSSTGWNIWRWKDGQSVQLTRGRYRDYTVSAAPDGKTVYFASTRAESADAAMSDRVQIFRMEADGVPVRVCGPLSHVSGGAVSPRVSPDGRILAFAQTENMFDTWRIRIARTNDPMRSAAITPDDMYAYSPNWSPDGRYLTFAGVSREVSRWGVWIVEPVSGTLKRLSDGVNPSFSPDGKSVIYDLGGHVRRRQLSSADWPSAEESTASAPEKTSRVLFRLDEPETNAEIPMSPDAELGDAEFWVRVRFRMDTPRAGLRHLFRFQYEGDDTAVQMFFRDDARPIFAGRQAYRTYAPLESEKVLEPGREYDLVGYRRGSEFFLFVDGGAPETVRVVGGTRCYRQPQRMWIGKGFGGKISLVECGLGTPTGVRLPPTAAEIFAEGAVP